MPRWMFAAAILTLGVALPVAPAQGGWFSSHGDCHADDCCPSCAAPVECYTAPECCAPAAPECCAPAAPVCCAPAAPSCGCPDQCHGYDACCDTGCGHRRESGLKSCFRKLMDLERRKNRCLADTFLPWRKKNNHCHSHDCAPNYYYQPACAAPQHCH